MDLKVESFIFWFLVFSGLSGCAGPTTPIGAIWEIQPPRTIPVIDDDYEVPAPIAIKNPYTPKIEFYPRRQVLHRAQPVVIRVNDPAGVNLKGEYGLSIRYDGYDVTRAFLSQASRQMSSTGTRLILKLPVLRLSPEKVRHHINVSYRGSAGEAVNTSYRPPACSLSKPQLVKTTEHFNPSRRLLKLIDQISRNKGVNPSFTTGLIAQESAFHTFQVSWAKAIGLTQITPVAEEELLRHYSDFPRYPGLNSMSVAKIRTLILMGEINEKNEWRLNPEYSSLGGLTYAQLVIERWSTPENEARIQFIFKDPELAKAKLVLASYNSGYARVLTALARRGKDWMNSPELREARKYVNRIFSYCDHFSDGGSDEA